MSTPWSPEQVMSAELARELIESQFPDLAPVALEWLGAGWDNTAFLVNREWVFRFPRREVAVGLLKREARALTRLEPHLPLAVPVPTRFGEASEAFPWPFQGYRVLPGRTACVAGLDGAQREAAAEPLAAFLKALHGLPGDLVGGLELPGDEIGRLDLERRLPAAKQGIQDLADRGLIATPQPWHRFLDTIAADPPRPALGPTLVHGDLYARHLVVDEAGRLTGIIDWGDVHIGSPALDLAVVYGFLPAVARPAFFARYGAIDGETERLARYRAIAHATNVCRYAADINDGALLWEGLLAFEQALR